MLNAEQTLEKMGIALGRHLGNGGFAHVYEYHDALTGELDPTRVVKITEDEADGYVAELARQAQERGECKNVVRVYQVVECKSRYAWKQDQGLPAYIIISERLQEIPDEMQMPGHGGCIKAGHYDLVQAIKAVERDGYEPVEWYQHKDDVWTMAASNVYGMAKDLMSLGVKSWDDYKPKNTMYRPGYGIVVSDLGCMESPKPTIQRMAA